MAEGGRGGRQQVDVGGGQGQRGQRRVLVTAVRSEQSAPLRSEGLRRRQGGEQALHGAEGDPVGQRRRQPQRLGVGGRPLSFLVLPQTQEQQHLFHRAQRHEQLTVEVDDQHGPLPRRHSLGAVGE